MENTTGVMNVSTDAVDMSADSEESNCTFTVPSAGEMFLLHTSEPWSTAVLIVVSILSFLTCLLFIETAYSATRSLEYGTRRGYTMFILGLVPVFSVTSLTGIYIPKAALVGIWAASVYLSVSLYIFLMLIFNYFGGPDEMVAKLAKTKISLSQPPLACCCPCCCRKIWLTTTNLHRLRVAVLQMAVVYPLTYFITAILWADGLYNPAQLDPSSAYLYLTVLMIASTLTAMYALTIINVAADASLAAMYGTFRLRFSLLKFFMIVPSLQGLVISIVSQVVNFSCEGVLAPSIRASLWYNILVVIEMFLLLLIGRCRALFDKYHGPLLQANQADSLSTSQTRYQYSEIREVASPMLDAEGNKPAFPAHLLDVEKAPLDCNQGMVGMNGAELPSQSRVRQTVESDV
ncbi:organic solute transporter subunit alpha-like [Patiria miniata]|uniref:Organic solute transporter subunit alpha n=1 Tax=Patiria miniata TaxID=46514 RepID=A0A914A7A9_PATMI|nr:organic solute transporter subunit alpha-like [Patiria miniata]